MATTRPRRGKPGGPGFASLFRSPRHLSSSPLTAVFFHGQGQIKDPLHRSLPLIPLLVCQMVLQLIRGPFRHWLVPMVLALKMFSKIASFRVLQGLQYVQPIVFSSFYPLNSYPCDRVPPSPCQPRPVSVSRVLCLLPLQRVKSQA